MPVGALEEFKVLHEGHAILILSGGRIEPGIHVLRIAVGEIVVGAFLRASKAHDR